MKEKYLVAKQIKLGEGACESSVLANMYRPLKDIFIMDLKFQAPNYRDLKINRKDYVLISCCKKGFIKINYGDKRITLVKDMVMLDTDFSNQEIYEVSKKGYRGISILINKEYLGKEFIKLAENFEGYSDNYFEIFQKKHAIILQAQNDLTEMMRNLFDLKKSPFEFQIKLLSFMIDVKKCIEKNSKEEWLDTRKELVNRIKEYIKANLNLPLTSSHLGDRFEMTDAQVKMIFNKVEDRTLTSYIKSVKLKFACYELLYSDKSIKQISEDVGYANPSKFSKFFKSSKGDTPLRYRIKNQTSLRLEKIDDDLEIDISK